VSGWGSAPRWADWGADFYAAVSWNDLPRSDPRRIWIGWANNWSYAQAIPTYPSRGLMTVPRTVRLIKTGAGYRIAQAPIAELDRVRTDHRASSGIRVGEHPVSLPVSGDSVDLTLDIDAGTAEQLAIVLTDGRGYQTLVGVTPATNEVFIDRTRSGPHFHDAFPVRHVAPVDLKSRKVRLRLLVDKSIIELFVNDGTTTITDRFFRSSGDLSWSAVARGGSATVRAMDFWAVRQP
jgi:fructan beta-fructosidase